MSSSTSIGGLYSPGAWVTLLSSPESIRGATLLAPQSPPMPPSPSISTIAGFPRSPPSLYSQSPRLGEMTAAAPMSEGYLDVIGRLSPVPHLRCSTPVGGDDASDDGSVYSQHSQQTLASSFVVSSLRTSLEKAVGKSLRERREKAGLHPGGDAGGEGFPTTPLEDMLESFF